MNKKIFRLIIPVLLISTISASCNKKVDVNLHFNVQDEINVEVGNYFSLPKIECKDSLGNLYFPIKKVTDSSGQNIEIDEGKFFPLQLGDYTLSYEVEFKGEVMTKQTKLHVIDTTSPSIEFDKDEINTINGSVIDVPSITIKDNYSKKESIISNYEVTFNETKVPVNEGKFTLENIGTYAITYTAIDENNNVSSKILPVNSYAAEDDCVSYFGKSFGTDNLTPIFTGGFFNSSREHVLPGEDYSMEYSIGPAVAGGFNINAPYIKDITSYKYLYYYVYTEDDIRLTYNAIYTPNGNIEKGRWNKIVLTRTGEGDNIDYLTSTGERVFYDSYNGCWTLKPTNISGLNIYLYIPETGCKVYFSSLRVANELPEIDIDFPKSKNVGDEFKVPQVDSKYTSKIYLDNNGNLTLLEDSILALTKQGTYSFVYEVYENEKLIDIINKSFICLEKEEGNISYFNKSFGYEFIGTSSDCTVSSTNELTYGDDEYSLKLHMNVYELSWGKIKLDNLAITNLNEKDEEGNYIYNYIYFYVYSDTLDGLNINGCVWKVEFETSKWCRIVLTRQGDTFVATDSFGTVLSIFAVNEQYPARAENLNNFYLLVLANPGSHDIYFSSMMAVKDLPA